MTNRSASDFLIASRQAEIAELEQLARDSGLVEAVGRLIHALQRERGLSNLYPGASNAARTAAPACPSCGGWQAPRLPRHLLMLCSNQAGPTMAAMGSASGSISHYIKEIGRGKQGARALTREQAADLFGRVLDGTVTDLELGAFCLAMRIKGETADEMAGFLDATAARLQSVPVAGGPAVVLPSYNGARKLPVLTPLLALLLARRGVPVVMHGLDTEVRRQRVSAAEVLAALDIAPRSTVQTVAPGQVAWLPTALLCPGLARLLEVRRVVGVRNSAHSLVKLMNPCAGPAVVVGSYTHPEYALSMAEVFRLTRSTALLLRGTEGEPVADPRRLPAMEGFVRGDAMPLEEGRKGPLDADTLPPLPDGLDARATAAWIREVLAGQAPVPQSIEKQVDHLVRLAQAA